MAKVHPQENSPPTAMISLSKQLVSMLQKSFILQRRFWISTLLQAVVIPVVILTLLFGIQQGINNASSSRFKDPVAYEMAPVQKCLGSGCVTVLYSPEQQPYTDIMAKFVTLNAKRGVLLQGSVKAGGDIYSELDANPNKTAWAVNFGQQGSTVQYQLWFNSTNTARVFQVAGAPPFVIGRREPFNDEVVSMVRALDEAIIAHSNNDEDLHLNYKLKDFPDMGVSASSRCPPNPDTVASTLGPVFLFIPMTVIFFTTVNMVAGEKENNLKMALKVVGLSDGVYWISHFLAVSGLVVVNAIVTCAAGKAFDFSTFAQTDFSVLFVVFLLFGLAQVAFALALASLTSKVKVAIGLGFFIVIVGSIFLGIGSLFAYAVYTAPGASIDLNPLHLTFMFFPFFNFNKILVDIGTYTNYKKKVTQTSCTFEKGSEFRWEDLYKKISGATLFDRQPNDRIPIPEQSLWFFVMNIIVWLLLALYLDKVIPNENGYSEHPLFFLFPSFYGFKDPSWMRSKLVPRQKAYVPPKDEDPDVAQERAEANAIPEVDESGLRLASINKVYHAGLKNIVSWVVRLFGHSDAFLTDWSDFWGTSRTAIHEVSIVVEKGTVLAYNGSNGSGKTSTMKIIMGVSPLSSGYMSVFGQPVGSQEISKRLAVCFQFDLLYPDLTATEHIRLWCGIKGIPQKQMASVGESRMKQMRLWNVRDNRSSTFSGGMKRRLSVILATLGDPDIVLLDEPTTGMDSFNKRCVWQFLETFKKDRVIILTTHSMEEADILANKIAIMSKGKLRAVGKSLTLKNKFGSGFRISMVVPKALNVEDIKKQIKATLSNAFLLEEEYVGGAGKAAGQDLADQSARLVYEVQTVPEVKVLLKYLEQESKKTDSQIASFGMTQTSLEDVFLKMVKGAE